MRMFRSKASVKEAAEPEKIEAEPIDPARYVIEDPFAVMREHGLEVKPKWDDPEIRHLDGVPWYSAPVPPRGHDCWPQTDGWIGLKQVQRCACGAIRGSEFRRWLDRNSRKAA